MARIETTPAIKASPGGCLMCGDDLETTGWVELLPCKHILCPHCLCCREALRWSQPLLCPKAGCNVTVEEHCYVKAKGLLKGENPPSNKIRVKHCRPGVTKESSERPLSTMEESSNSEEAGSNLLSLRSTALSNRLSRQDLQANVSGAIGGEESIIEKNQEPKDPGGEISKKTESQLQASHDTSSSDREQEKGVPVPPRNHASLSHRWAGHSSNSVGIAESHDLEEYESTTASSSISTVSVHDGVLDPHRPRRGPQYQHAPYPGYTQPPQHGPLYGDVNHDPAAPPVLAAPPGLDTLTDKRARRNAMSRARAAKKKQQIAELKRKPKNELTASETMLLTQFEERRNRKNRRSKERQIELTTEMARILAKPQETWTDNEKSYLKTLMERKLRKNEGDRIRRANLKKPRLLSTATTVPAAFSPVLSEYTSLLSRYPMHHEVVAPLLAAPEPIPTETRRPSLEEDFRAMYGHVDESRSTALPHHSIPNSGATPSLHEPPAPFPPLHPGTNDASLRPALSETDAISIMLKRRTQCPPFANMVAHEPMTIALPPWGEAAQVHKSPTMPGATTEQDLKKNANVSLADSAEAPDGKQLDTNETGQSELLPATSKDTATGGVFEV